MPSSPQPHQGELSAAARAWLAADPDSETRSELSAIMDDADALVEHFATPLRFGTAGIRGRMGPGPARMNRVLVRMVAAALADRLLSDRTGPNEIPPEVVIGFDARHNSDVFAEDMARVLAARDVRVVLLDAPRPTPVLAFAVRHLGASVGVMVTASHNPATDNGVKVYWDDGIQIISPIDGEIMAALDSTAPLTDASIAALDHRLIVRDDGAVHDAYLGYASRVIRAGGPRAVTVAYTPLHGVGCETLCEAFVRAGFSSPNVVTAQAAPDPDFPSTPFPNPEEPGATDALLALAEDIGADIALANDPDADRIAVAVPTNAGWRLLTGDEVGWLLADHVLAGSSGPGRMVTSSIVSSTLLSRLASACGVEHRATLTGFKWIMRPAADPRTNLVFGYEEALGYAVSNGVRDKDGITAALVVAELAASMAAEGSSLTERLRELQHRYGVTATGQRSLRFEAQGNIDLGAEAMASLRGFPPGELGGRAVESVVDLAKASADLPATEALMFVLDGGRVLVRPSGTEPKMKVYAEITIPPTPGVDLAQLKARGAVAKVLDDAVSRIAMLEEHRAVERQFETATAHSADEIEARAKSLMDKGRTIVTAKDLRTLVRCIDLTTLEGADTAGRIRSLCATARRPHGIDATVGPVASVCVYPTLVSLAAELLTGSSVRVASVAGAFPSGLSEPEVRLADIRSAVASGADEIDMVLDRSAFLDGDFGRVRDALTQAREAVGDRILKVILEVGELRSLDNIAGAARLAIDAGADFIKTSTGKISVGATPVAVLCMAETIETYYQETGERIGLKVSGGVRTAEDALGYLHLLRTVLGDDWIGPDLIRFGASSLVGDVVESLDRLQTSRPVR